VIPQFKEINKLRMNFQVSPGIETDFRNWYINRFITETENKIKNETGKN